MNEIFTEEAYAELIDALFRRFPSFQKVGAGAYKPGIANMEFADQLMGHPHRKYRIIHVAGTNGKGSVSNMLAAVLQQAGYHTGLFTSPHLTDFRERIRVNGEMISADSMQVYRFMDIGTAKIMPEDMQGIKHYLIDELEPDEEFHVVRFQQMAKRAMEEIYAKYGRYLSKTDSFEFPGLSGMDKMAGIMTGLRENPLTEIGGYAVTKVVDYKKTEETGLPAANVLVYTLEGGATVIVRPSGTEPKIKTYFTTLGKDLAEAEAQKKVLADALKPILA